MTQINPFAGAITQGAQVQRTQAAEKDRQVRRHQDQAKNSALAGESIEHEVESTDAPTPVHEESQRRHPSRKRRGANKNSSDSSETDTPPHIDLRA